MFADYSAGPLDITGSAITNSNNDDIFAGVRATYEFGGQFRALGSLAVSSSEFGNDSTSIAIGGGYNIADNLWVDASFSNTSDGVPLGDLQSIGLVLTY